MNFHIRRAQPADLNNIMQIMDEIQQGIADPSWFVPSDRTFVEKHLLKKGFTLVAEDQIDTAAFLMVVFAEDCPDHLGRDIGLSEKERTQTAYMDTVAVLPRARGNGLQARLINTAEQILRSSAYCHWMATVHPENHYSLQNFINCGYRILCTKKKYGGLDRHILYKYNPSSPGSPDDLISPDKT